MTEWTKPSIWSTIVIVACLAVLGVLVYTGKLAVGEMLGGDLMAVVLWLTQGARKVTAPEDVAPVTKRVPGNDAGFALPRVVHFLALSTAVAFGIALAALHGCAHGVAAREQARAAVVVTSQGVKEASDACATIALARNDLELAKKCRDAYDAARIALIATGTGVDAWDRAETSRSSVTCAVLDAAHELDSLAQDIEAAGGKLPPILDDARVLIKALGPCIGATTGEGGPS